MATKPPETPTECAIKPPSLGKRGRLRKRPSEQPINQTPHEEGFMPTLNDKVKIRLLSLASILTVLCAVALLNRYCNAA